MVGGLPGSGKSTLADAIAKETGAVVLRTDEVRKELAGVGLTEELPAEMYSTEMKVATYSEVLKRAKAVIESGEDLVLDATWSKADSRVPVREMAKESGVGLLLEVNCVASKEVLAARLGGRPKERAHGSDAGVAVMEAMAFDDWPEALVVDATKSVAEMQEAVKVAVAQGLAGQDDLVRGVS